MEQPALFEENVIRVCKICGRRLAQNRTEDICHACAERQLFNEVRDYIRANDVKDFEVAEHFNIPIAQVKRWIKEGRIQYKEETVPRDVIMANYCQICGRATSFGTICTECMREKARKKKHGVAITDLKKTEHNRMQFIEEEGHGRK